MTREDRFLVRARLLAHLLMNAPRHRTGVHLHVPDGEGWKPFAWVDCMHTDAPFLAHLGRVTGEARYADAAAEYSVAAFMATIFLEGARLGYLPEEAAAAGARA